MGFIIKNNQGLIITRLTDVGKRKISQGKFNISYFQIGDSEVDYKNFEKFDYTQSMVIEPAQNSQNNTGVPDSTKNGIKYPYFFSDSFGGSNGVPIQNSIIENVFNTMAPIGFFEIDNSCGDGTPKMKPQKSSVYTVNSQKSTSVLSTDLNGDAVLTTANINTCQPFATGTLAINQYVTLFANNISSTSSLFCSCYSSSTPILTYKIQNTSGTNLDRNLPNLSSFSNATGNGRLFYYPSSFTYYNTVIPNNAWASSTNNYGSVCSPENGLVKVWNMNIVWSENPAGYQQTNNSFTTFPSANYLGTKEYYGYSSNLGQTDTSSTFYYNSYKEKININPYDQKTVAIVHYSNNTLINWYGEKFADEPFDSTNPGNTGQARNFKVSLPWLMWHKNEYPCSKGAVFYIDPPGFDSHKLLKSYHIQSSKNTDMNSPGIRYYHLYDTNEAFEGGPPNRVGKVFPDDKIIIFDDEEIVAAMSYASNRNYTLPAPRLSLTGVTDGLLETETDCVWVTYLFDSSGVWDGMHCNYYTKIVKPITGCTNQEQDVIVSFGGDFNCMSQPTTSYIPGWYSKDFYILVQKTTIGSRPTSNGWKYIPFTNELTRNANNFISPSSLVQKNFVITKSLYNSASNYNINNWLTVPNSGSSGKIEFGEEYFFYGLIETDIEATIYEMKYNINLSSNEFVKSSNPTWSEGNRTLMTEVGLYDNENDLVVYSKFQSPQLRLGTQQIVVKLDF